VPKRSRHFLTSPPRLRANRFWLSNDHQWWRRYNRYLNSQGWQLAREAAFRRDGYRCRRCGTRGGPFNPLQANHLSYSAYNATGRTPVTDLETVCRGCHQVITGRRFRNYTLSQVFRQFWRRLTWKQKAVLIFMAWLLLAFIHDRVFPPPIRFGNVPTLHHGVAAAAL
jgi:5-methylcytosine-specific restriction endonuclease McrA